MINLKEDFLKENWENKNNVIERIRLEDDVLRKKCIYISLREYRNKDIIPNVKILISDGSVINF